MKLYKRLIALLMSILIIAIFPATVFAAESIDLDKNINLTIFYRNNETAIVNAEFNLYLVSSMGSNGELTTTDSFSKYNIDIPTKNDDTTTLQKAASTLEGYVLRDKISPIYSKKTNMQGTASFGYSSEDAKLIPGLYLLLSPRHQQGSYYYEASPIMLFLPSKDASSNTLSYNVTCIAKYDTIPLTSSTVTRSVLKVWDDDENENIRPKEVVIQLLKDGVVYDTATLNKGNNWRYTWSDLASKYKWNVVEKEIQDYTVIITQDDSLFTITNTYIGKPQKPSLPEKLPQTGQLWWPVPILLFTGLLLIVLGLIRRRGNSNEK